jgi:hypothetical protein
VAKAKEKLTPVPRRKRKPARLTPDTSVGDAAPSGPDLSHIAPGLLKTEVVALADLAFMTGNAVRHPEKQIAEIGASLRQFQQVEPLVVNRREIPPVVIGGNGRLQAMLAAGITHAAVCFVDLDRSTANALALALNRTADGREYDREAVQKLLQDVSTGGDPVIEQMLADLARDVGVVPDKDNGGDGADGGGVPVGQYGVIVICRDEAHQKEVYERLLGQGLEVKVVVT